MIQGFVSEDRTPYIPLDIGKSEYMAVVDSGFNGDLDLPITLQTRLPARPAGEVNSTLANGMTITQNLFQINLIFDGEQVEAFVTFSDSDDVLVGTRLLRLHKLEISFPARTLRVERMN